MGVGLVVDAALTRVTAWKSPGSLSMTSLTTKNLAKRNSQRQRRSLRRLDVQIAVRSERLRCGRRLVRSVNRRERRSESDLELELRNGIGLAHSRDPSALSWRALIGKASSIKTSSSSSSLLPILACIAIRLNMRRAMLIP